MQASRIQPTLKEKQRRERETLILEAAEEVLIEKGYYETSMDEIAARVGIAKGTIYSHFPGKEELITAIFAQHLQRFLDGIDTVIATKPTPREKLEALLQFMYEGFHNKNARLLASMYGDIDLKHIITKRKSCMSDMWHTLITRVTQLLEAGKSAGEFAQTIPTQVMVISFFRLFAPRSYDPLMLEDTLSQDELIKQLCQVYFHGIAAHK
ncbi:MAG TPA: TetR/AcrR family transcriptional regulator [Dictyobacter sp.]|jgi:AcrR family transcriptional regulator|nr:TetR/AcrR family transcriptional regulator [Dictyobacter sp.]